MTDDARATLVNPAGLSIPRGPNSILLFNYSRDKLSSWSFLSQTQLGGLGYERRREFPEYSRFIWALGGPITRRVHLGLRFTRTYWPEKAQNSLDAGLLWRPSKLLSIGAVSNYLNQPGGFKRSYTVGLALRPLTNRLTLFFDSNLQEDEELKNTRFFYGGEVEPVDGVIIHGSVDDERRFRIGVALHASSFGLGYRGGFDESGELVSGSFGMTFTSETYRTFLKSRHRFVDLELSGSIVDEKSGGLWGALFGGGGRTTKEITDLIEKARKDDTVDGIMLNLGNVGAGWGKLQEIRESLSRFRRSGKLIVCYLESGGDASYYLASVADKILLNPGGYLDLDGLSAESIFLKNALDKLGIKADLESIGEYKSAAEILTRDSMSDAHKEVMNSILDDVYSQFTNGIGSGRGMSRQEVIEKVDGGPYMPRAAYEAGLVDSLVYEDEIDEIAKELNRGRFTKVKSSTFACKKNWRYDWGPRPRIALIYACGFMLTGESGYNPILLGKYMGSATVAKAIRKAREDESIRAIVFRVDSPGGIGLASEVIWREVSLAKEEKPFIVSMADVAGSGGYHISCAADTIVAEPGTITGSIGVIAGKFDMHGLYDKLGMDKEIITRGRNAAIFSDYREFTPEEREIVRSHLMEAYRGFVDQVAQGRGMEWEDVDAVGRGRVWTGNQAVQNGLVDVLGGLETALRIAKVKARIPEAEVVEMVVLPERKGFFGAKFASLLNWKSGLNLSLPLKSHEPLYLMSYSPEIE
jgi:protease-4